MIVVKVDRARCTGNARCAAEAPAVFTLDDDGYSTVTELILDDSRRDEALRGARACPERVITVEQT